MLVISNNQMNALSEQAGKRYEEGYLAHLQRHHPAQSRLVGEPALKTVIHQGVERAERYGIGTQRNTGVIIRLMLMLGAYFDRDPLLPWAGAALRDESANENQRIARLEQQAGAYLEATVGPDNQHLLQALHALRTAARGDLQWPSGQPRPVALRGMLQPIYPEKLAHIPDRGLELMARGAVRRARRFQVDEGQGLMVYMVLLFMLGAGCDRDPQYPWLRAALLNPAVRDSKARGEALKQAALDYLDQILSLTAPGG